MVTKSNICSSVEGENLKFDTRQFFQGPPFYHEHLQKRVFPFKLGINGHVKIIKPFENATQAIVNTKSLTEIDDAIQGGSVDGWSTRPIKNAEKNTGATGTHSATVGNIKGHAYAHVQSAHRDHLQSQEIMTRHPDVEVVINPVYLAVPAE